MINKLQGNEIVSESREAGPHEGKAVVRVGMNERHKLHVYF
jgi:hypothetical protein